MASEMKLVRRGPLDGFAAELSAASSDAVNIRAVPIRSAMNLRGPAIGEFSRAIEAAAGVGLPLEPNRWVRRSDRAAIWLGPDEWLLVGPTGDTESIERALRSAMPDDQCFSLVDVAQKYTSFLLSGPHVRDVLAGGCALDLHPHAFASGDCARTILAKTRVLLRAVGDDCSIEVWVQNSYAGYTARWLIDAVTSFRVRAPVQPAGRGG